MSDVLLESNEQISVITLNRPEELNAFTLPMLGELIEAFRTAGQDPECRVIVLTGAGRGFCSGGQGGSLQRERTPYEMKQEFWTHIQRVPLTVHSIEKPVIAAVNGPAVGAGCDFALMCDLRVAAESARFSEAYVKVGLVPGEGGAHFLPRIVGTAKALELLWTGDFVSGPQAMEIGLANACVPDDELMAYTMELARRIADRPPAVVQIVKRAVRMGQALDLAGSLDLISSHMAIIRSMDDTKEALRAFKAKERPSFTGR
ncbi:enoyl-CoA hydratase/isomerase family protein [Actinophytocola sp.]|uniref:enoyl-CoA hydratase/isomerase family protein n=1 Tax=Actinophytocola sp. TaxID=1872138 RepID=UPI003D6C329C